MSKKPWPILYDKSLKYQDTFINSGINLYLQSEPQKANKIITGDFLNRYIYLQICIFVDSLMG